jgi:phosphoribosylformylglycinamidine cyclo-ligase
MQRTFNCGIGMVAIVAAADADRALTHLRGCGEEAWVIGRIEPRLADEARTLVR